jgi:endogenous inhibitor of DNA gyrase (YacG/DUF329 family)
MQIKDEALQQVILLRTNGMSYRKIAEYTRLPYEKIRYQCRNLDCDKTPVDEEMPSKIQNREVCAYCGRPITENEHSRGRKKRFCCEECRRKYWKIHRDEQKQKPTAIYTKVCPYCGKTFEVYGNKHRKYCCHEHYVADYFGDGKHSRVS